MRAGERQPSEQPVFTYSAAQGGYQRTEPSSGAFTDADTGKPVIFGTVVVVPVPVTSAGYTDVNGVSALAYTLQGTGGGQLFTAGQEFGITWSQGATGPPQLTLSTGGPAPVSPGLVLICLVPTGTTATFGPS